jgi:isopenicillin N synthase-like dioxygenase
MYQTVLVNRPDPREFFHHGYLRVRISSDVVALIEDIIESARAFFRQADSSKGQACLPGITEGWRAFAGEFSITPDRPDLHESFWVTRGRALQAATHYGQGLAGALHEKMLRYLDIVQGIEAVIITDLLSCLCPDSRRTLPRARSVESDLQVLYYQPALQRRDLLQDAHEDSLSLTFTWADHPGLELLARDGLFHPAELASDELAVLPGEILALMTGFRVLPQVHRVARHATQAERLTLSYFSAPDVAPGETIEPWIRCRENESVSIAERVCSNRLRYLVE